MDTRTGEITLLTQDEMDKRNEADLVDSLTPGKERRTTPIRTRFVPIDPAILTPRARRQLEASGRTQVSRNSPCPCGSKKRFKRCHMEIAR